MDPRAFVWFFRDTGDLEYLLLLRICTAKVVTDNWDGSQWIECKMVLTSAIPGNVRLQIIDDKG